MLKFEKATYSRLALNEAMKQLKAVHITARWKSCYYPIYSDLNAINVWLEDHAGNSAAFHCYYLEEYKDRLYNHYKDTTAKQFSRLARLAKRDMIENIHSIFRDGKAGLLNII